MNNNILALGRWLRSTLQAILNSKTKKKEYGLGLPKAALFIILLMLLMPGTKAFAAAVSCGTESAGNGSGYASSGTGQFRDSIFWLDWSCGANTQFNAGDVVTKSWDVGSGIIITATLSNISNGDLLPYNSGDWWGDTLNKLYGGVNPIGLGNVSVTDSSGIDFDVTFSATLNGSPIPADIVVAEAEDTGNADENASWTTDGSQWRPIEASGTLDVQFSNANRTIFMSELPNAGGGSLLALTEDVTTLNVNLQSQIGRDALAFGVFIPFDYGDAAGMPDASHYNGATATGGSQPSALTSIASLTMATVQFTSAHYLGSTPPDPDAATQGTTTANGDDVDGQGDDEDGITIPALTRGETATITATVNGASGYLQGWIDWNGDGDFLDSGEQIASDLQDGGGLDTNATAGTIAFAVTVPAGAITSQTFARFRWSTTQGLDSTAAATNGEVEDYAVTINSLVSSCVAVPVTTLGDAYVNANNEYVLTDDANFKSGFIWSNDQIDLSQPFDIQLGVYLGSNVGIDPSTGLDAGADGLSFILQNDPRGTAAQGYNGGYMGVDGDINLSASGLNNRAVYPSVTIEFDTFDNTNISGFTGDLAADHTGIYLNGDVALPDPANTLLSAVAIGAGGEIEDGKYHITRYVWDPATQNFTYYFDGVQLASVTRDLVSYFGSSYVRFGFAAATGASKNLQKACWLDEPALVDPGYDLTGTIFEDVNYGGGAGRDLATASGAGVTAAVVELYDASGNLASTTTTAADGRYTFNNVLDGSYHVRVVSNTVSSTRTGANGSELGVQTFRTDGTTAVTGEVGGRKPAVADGTANGGAETLNATTFALSGGGAVQSLQPVTVAGADIAGIDFGFNFDTIVNTNDSGQGSLRQFILNSNLLTDIPNQGINAGQETSIFMVPDGSAYVGTESHTTLDLTTAGVVVIKPATVLPIITDDAVSVDGSTQSGASCGGIRDANGAITDRSVLVALDGTNAGTGATADGLTIGSADGVTVKGLSIGNFDSDGLRADNSTNFTATCNHIGLAANGIALAGNNHKGIVLNGVTSADIGDATVSGMNVVGANTNDGIWMEGTIDDVIIDMNYVGIAADGNTSVGNGRGYVGSGISFAGYTGNIVSDGEIIRNNVISGNGFELGGFYGTTNNVLIENNLLGTDATGLLDRTDQWYLIIAEDNEGWIIRNNVIAGSDQGSGIELYSMSNMTIQGNKIGVGIDGTTAIGNGFWGVRIDGGAGHVIGGLGAGEGNIVANNSQDSVNGYSGILIQSGAAATISGNTIHSNLASGVQVSSSTSLVTISRNQIFNNTGLGIDLRGNEVTNNDANDVDTGANSLLNFPQFKQSILVGSNLIISGCAPAGATIELFEADVSPTSVSVVAAGSNQFGETQDYGEGEVFLTSWVMPASGTACAMSTDADGNNPSGMLAFSQTFALTSLPAGTNIELNDKLTATATVSGTGTSEFSAIGLIVANKLNGIVFEDINYGGGAGRDQSSASGVGVNGVTVELYDNTGALRDSTTTANDGTNDGAYEFAGLTNGDYHVRVVSDTVSSTRTGANGSELGVQTFRTDGTTAVTGEVGGRKPAVADGTANGGAETLNATTFALSGGGAVQSLQPVTVAGADIAGIDFGFNFDTIVNTNDSGQGSLRQFILNSNLLTDIPNQGINAGQETSIFMVPDGSAYVGTESHTTLDLTTAGVVVIKPATVLPIITDDAVSVDGSTQSGASCGGIRDANGAITDRSVLVALDGTNAGTGATADGLTIGSADGVTVKGLSIGNFDSDGLRADNSTNFTATCNHIGLAANGIALAGNNHKGIVLNGVTSADIGDATVSGMNVVGANTNDGIWMEGTIDDVIIDMNYVGIAADGNTSVGNGRGYVGSGISFAGYTGNIVSDGEIIRNNVISGNGFELGGFYGTTNNVLIENNLLGTDATGLLDRTDQWYLIIAEDNEGWIIRNNVIAGSDQGSGIELYSMSNMTIQGNKIGVGIDGTTAIGNGFWGVRIDGGAGHVIGGLGAGEGNIVANNSQDSVNGYSGILIQSGAAATISGNTIHSNLASGVQVSSSTSLVTISRNQIFNNTGLGIDLRGNEVTNNDANDVDTGANSLLNFPQFKQSILVGSNLIISGCAPAGATIELFEADVSPTSVSVVAAGSNQFGETQDYGEGEVFLTSWVMPASGTACAMSTDADGNNPSGMLAFSQTFALTSLPAGTNIELNDKLTATATVSGTGTSEFSAVAIVAGQDYGDAPDNYLTKLAVDGARHDVVNDVYLGSVKPDVDTDGQPSIAANDDGVDEEGVSLPLPVLNAHDRTYAVTVKTTNVTSSAATLMGWIDFDGNGAFDADEVAIRTISAGASAADVELKWSVIPIDISAGDTYMRLRLTTDSISNTEPGGAKRDGEVEDYALSITTKGVSVSGRVYNDTDVDGVNDSTEIGVSGLPVVLFDGATCQSVRTDAEGNYRFDNVEAGTYQVYEASRETVPVPTNCGVANARDPKGYRSTTDNVSSSFVVSNADITGVDFGDVKEPSFKPDHVGTVLPGNVVLYAHEFVSQSTGTVTFTSANSTPATAGWSQVLYQDTDCNGELNGSEGNAEIEGDVIVAGVGNPVCVINKVYAPSNVNSGEDYSNVITADFTFGDPANATAGSIALTVTDLTTAAASNETSGVSRLELYKTVENVTQNTGVTATQNGAKPGDELLYRIQYQNTGSAPLTELVINDVVPEFTTIVGSPTCETPLPNSLISCTPVVIGSDIRWTFPANDALQAGETGYVNYKVKVD
ncbi:MAG: Unknown protein [uncultured Thiotrichaceae bacterium]|uniref:Uncharacterized protein n=1 Tax=uncultured Thiotrichaceae bacterium TaxID=298394 RepID=A0A6S6U935_9GAMM|nr:MAG: Unknown protein [uncultured Thiotrichaceae bacterium]